MIDKPILVVSHQRAGTHFLINSLAMNLDYPLQWRDLDYQIAGGAVTPEQPWSLTPSQIRDFLESQATSKQKLIFKSHHPYPFFAESLDILNEHFQVFYIYRDGRDVMTSYWHLILGQSLYIGPKCQTVGEFQRAKPCGWCCRYNINAPKNMLERWTLHIDSWLSADLTALKLLRYEDLNTNFEQTFAQILSSKKDEKLIRPAINSSMSYAPWRGISGNWKRYYTSEDEAFFNQQASATMQRAGYFLPDTNN